MIYSGTIEEETIFITMADNPNDGHYISLLKSREDPVFYVTCCCREDWAWMFWYSTSSYEKIKYVIMTEIAHCETMEELTETLSNDFVDGFADLLVQDDFECEEYNGLLN